MLSKSAIEGPSLWSIKSRTMLCHIRIRNFAIIKELSLDFKKGLNLLTGETGAGKSIIIDALQMLMGERSSSSLIRSGEAKAIVEGVFKVHDDMVQRILEKSGIPSFKEMIIKREMSASGGSKVFINGEIGSISILKRLAPFLINIHGQHQHQSLLNLQEHLALLDTFGENDLLKEKLQGCATELTDYLHRFQNLQDDLEQREQKLDFLKFQIEEIERCSPRPGEDQALSRERERLRNAERLRSLVKESYVLAYEEDRSLLSLLQQLKNNVEKLSEVAESFRPYTSRLAEAIFAVEELSLLLRDSMDQWHFDPDRLSWVEERIADLERIKKKYGQSMEEVVAFRERALQEKEKLLRINENFDEIKEKVDECYKRYRALALELSEKRRQDASRFSSSLLGQLKELAMDKSRFQIIFHDMDLPEHLDARKDISFGSEGGDRVEFFISVNVGEELKPLARVASGGELSRIMLAITFLMKKQTRSKTLIFDEVDAGIGGHVASIVGRKLKSISEHHQILCVTHLPQIASFADHHIKVAKTIEQKRTVVHVSILKGEEKIKEIARMMAGERISETSLRHAKEMVRSYGRRNP